MASPLTTVGHIKDSFLPKSETFIYQQLLAHRRYRPIVLDRFAQQNAAIFPFDDHFTPVGRWPGAAFLERAALRTVERSPWLEQQMRAQNLSLLHAHFGQLGALWASVANRLSLPLITSFYGIDLSVFAVEPAWKRRFARLWAHGSYFVALGPRMAERLVELGADPARTVVIPLIVDVDQFEAITRIPPSAGPTILLTVGRLIPKKGTDLLLQALALLPNDRNFELWIVGDGPLRPTLEQLGQQLNLTDRLRFFGWQTPAEVAARMAQAHIFLLPSRTDPQTGEMEGTPTVLVEAQARALPVVSTIHADIPSIVADGESGLLVPEGDVAALRDALAEMLRQPERWRTMGEQGRAYVERRHAPTVVGSQLEQLYDRALR